MLIDGSHMYYDGLHRASLATLRMGVLGVASDDMETAHAGRVEFLHDLFFARETGSLTRVFKELTDEIKFFDSLHLLAEPKARFHVLV